jgi:hypothetical protein
MWFIFQATIVLAVVQSNVSWQWADHGIQVGIMGVGLAWIATAAVAPTQSTLTMKPLERNRTVQPMTRARKVAVLIAACLAAATQAQGGEQNPSRPPASIPNVVALMPPTARLVPSAPTPIPRAFGASSGRGSLASDLGYENIAGFDPGGLQSAYPGPTSAPAAPARPAPTPIPPTYRPSPLPPPEFDHEYKGQLIITKWNDYSMIRLICKDNPTAIACSYRTYDSVSGAAISCLIMLGPGAHDNERTLRHEVGHCNGWSNKHEGAQWLPGQKDRSIEPPQVPVVSDGRL